MEADSVPSSISTSSSTSSSSCSSSSDDFVTSSSSSSSATSASNSSRGFYSLFPPPDARSSTMMSDDASSSSSTSYSSSTPSSSLASFSTSNSLSLYDSSSSLSSSSSIEHSLAAAFSSSSPLGFSYASLTSAPSPTSSSQGDNSSSCSLFSSSAFSSSFSSPLDGDNSSSTTLSTTSCGIPSLPPPRIRLPASSSSASVDGSSTSSSSSASSSANMDAGSSSSASLSLFPESSSSSSLFSSSPFSSAEKGKKKKAFSGLRRGSAPSGLAVGEGEPRTVSLTMPPAPSSMAKRPHTLPRAKKPKIYSIRDYALVETLQEMHSSKLFAQCQAISIARTAIHVPARLADSYYVKKCQALHCRSPSPPPPTHDAGVVEASAPMPVSPVRQQYGGRRLRRRRSDLSATQCSPLLRKKRASWPNARSSEAPRTPTGLLHRRSTFPQMKVFSGAVPELHVHRRCSLSTPLSPSTTNHHAYHHMCPPPTPPFSTVGTRVHVVDLRQQLLQSHVAKKIQRGYAIHDPESDLFGSPDEIDEGYGADPFASDNPFDGPEEERHEEDAADSRNSPLPSSPRPSFCAPPLPERDEKDDGGSFTRSLCSEAFDLLLNEASSGGGGGQSEDVSMTSSNDCLTLETKHHSFSLSSGSQPMSLLHSSTQTGNGQHGVIGDRNANKQHATGGDLTLSSVEASNLSAALSSSASDSAQTSLDWWLSGVRSHSMTDTDNDSVCSSIGDVSVTSDASSSSSASSLSPRVDDLYEHSDSGDSTTASPALVSASSASESCTVGVSAPSVLESCTVAHLSFELAAADLRSPSDAPESKDGGNGSDAESECKTTPTVIGRVVSPGCKNRHKTSKKRRSIAMAGDDSESESGSDTEPNTSSRPQLKRQQSPRAEHRRSVSPPSAFEHAAAAAAAARSLSPPSATAAGATSPRNSRKRSLSPCGASSSSSKAKSSTCHTPSKRRPSSPDNVCCASCDVVQEHHALQQQQQEAAERSSLARELASSGADVEMSDASEYDSDYEEKDAECTHAHQSRRTTRASSPSSASRAQRTRIQNEESEKRQKAATATTSTSNVESVTVTCIMTTKSPPRIVLTRPGGGSGGAPSKGTRTRIVHFTSSLNSKALPFVPSQPQQQQQPLPPAATSSSANSSLNANARPFVPRTPSNGCRSTVLPSAASRGGSALFSDGAATA